jgi:hypothetical protein
MKTLFRKPTGWIFPLAGIVMAVPSFPGSAHADSGSLAALVIGLRVFLSTGAASAILQHTRELLMLLAPIAVKTIFSGCFDAAGFTLFLVLPISTLLFSLGWSAVLPEWQARKKQLISVTAWLVFSLGGFLFSFFRSPAVTYRNPLFGWWPGPVYESAIDIGPDVFLYFGGVALLGAAFLFWHKTGKKGITARQAILYFVLGTGSLLWVASPSQPEFDKRFTRALFAGEIVLHSTDLIQESDLDRYGVLADLHVRSLRRFIPEKGRPEPVHVYLYADAWEKRAFTGAFETSFVPVWLARPQVHITRDDFRTTIRHELVHALLKPYGNRLFGASWNGALIEGAAVALAPERSERFTIDELVRNGNRPPETVASLFNVWSFYTGRAGVGYTMSGSFLRWLMQTHGMPRFLEAYAKGNLEKTYNMPADSLISGWKRSLHQLKPDSMAGIQVAALYNQVSLFEQGCPRYQSSLQKALHQAAFLEARQQVDKAEHLLRASYEKSRNEGVWMAHSRLAFITNQQLADISDEKSPAIALRQADALFLAGNFPRAKTMFEEALESVEDSLEQAQWKAGPNWRSDSLTWRSVLISRYQPEKLMEEHISALPERELRLFLRAMSLETLALITKTHEAVLVSKTDMSLPVTALTIVEAFIESGHYAPVKRYLSTPPHPESTKRDLERRTELHAMIGILE